MRSHTGIVVACLLLACTDWTLGEAETAEVSVLTYNILHGADADGTLNLVAKGEFIARQEVDLAFLQEIDEECARSEGVDQMAVLGRITGMAPAFGAFMPYQGGRYGLGTLSALPVVSTRELRLPDGGEPRVALFSEVEVLGRPLVAVNVHLDWIKDDSSRYAQASALLLELATIDLPMIVAGDFNDVPASRTMRAFFEAGFSLVETPGATWNARAPTVDIDHILVRSGRGLRLESRGGAVLDQRTLSDHRPVLGRVVVHRR